MDILSITDALPKHIVDVKSLGKSGIESIIASIDLKFPKINQSVAMLFFESSTRTLLSFELAAKQLGCDVLTPDLERSSIQKGETLLDSIATVAAMGVDQMVIRCSENSIPEQAVATVGDQCRILNAGSGTDQHPTQALTDLSVLNRLCNGEWANLKIGIVGNISHSRVANSLINGLTLLGTEQLHLIGPDDWIPNNPPSIATCFTSMEEGLAGLDAVVMLRTQQERMSDSERGDVDSLQSCFRLEEKHLHLMSDRSIFMHPGPVMRDKDIASPLLSHPKCMVNEQVRTGVAVRRALLALTPEK